MKVFPRFNANDYLPLVCVWATPYELYKRGYYPVITACDAEHYWRRY